MLILAIETSCDETAIALLEDGPTVLSNAVFSQIKAHRQYGGVVPELASRMHTEKIHGLLEECLQKAKKNLEDVSHIAVTVGPGLEGSLLIGVSMAKALSGLLKVPLIPINHLQGHFYSAFLEKEKPNFPCICLLASGGHTLLTLAKNNGDFELIGQTRDDAVGEAFDKVARVLNLGYPGGPKIENAAKEGQSSNFKFPIPLKHDPLNFSFSGLKTAVIQTVSKTDDLEASTADIAYAFQKAAVETLVSKAIGACKKFKVNELIAAGGVVANTAFRDSLTESCSKENIRLTLPDLQYCTDNAAMIACAAYYALKINADFRAFDPSVKSNLSIIQSGAMVER